VQTFHRLARRIESRSKLVEYFLELDVRNESVTIQHGALLPD
jgi:hypothetical protein